MTQAGAAPRSEPTTAAGEFIPWTPERVRWTAGLMLALLIAAMDSTIVSTALPTIGGELGNFSLYPWVFSGYLLTATTTVPLWGRLADLYGRKRVLMVGMAIFVGASVLCGSAHSMLALVVFRGLQGGRRRVSPAGDPDGGWRHVPDGPASPDPGAVQRDVGGGVGDRADHGGRLRVVDRLALDL